MSDPKDVDCTVFSDSCIPVIVTDTEVWKLGPTISTLLESGRRVQGLPMMAQLGDKLGILDGLNRNRIFDGTSLIPWSVEQLRIVSHGENIGADYDKDDATYKYYVQLDDNAIFADDVLIGATITLINDSGEMGQAVVTDNWEAYSGSPYNGKPVVKIAEALAYDFTATVTTYKLHFKYKLTTVTESDGEVDEGVHIVLISYYDKTRDMEGATVELHTTNDYADLEFYTITVASPNNAIKIIRLPKPPSDCEATHWRVYMSLAGESQLYWIDDYAIGTWDEDKSITLTQPDSWIRTRPKREMLLNAFPTSAVLAVAMNRAFVGGTEVITGPGTLTLTTGERYFEISGGSLGKQHEGMRIQAAGSATAYEIRTILDEENGILYDAALEDQTNAEFRIFSWERHLFPSEIDPNTGKAHIEGTKLWDNALELPFSRGQLVTAGPLPGEDVGVYSREEAARITGRVTLQVVKNFQEGIVGKNSLVSVGQLTAGLNMKGIVSSDIGSLPEFLSEPVPKQFSDDEVNRQHHWRVPGLGYTAEGGTPYAMWFMAPADEDSLDYGMLINLATRQWTGVRGIPVSCLGLLTDAEGIQRPYAGTSFGQLLQLFEPQSSTNHSMGSRSTRRRGVVTSATATTLTDSTQSFETSGDGERGVPIWIIAGTGAGQMRYIFNNTATQILVHNAWDTIPDATSVYQLGALRAHAKRTWSDLGYPAATRKEVAYFDFLFEGYDALYGGDSTKVYVTKNFDTVKAVGSLTFGSNVVGQPLLIKGNYTHIGWIKSVNEDLDELTLISNWEGGSGPHQFTIGAPMLKVLVRTDKDSDNVWKTCYVPMHEELVSINVGVYCSFLQVEIESYDDAPWELLRWEPRFELKVAQ